MDFMENKSSDSRIIRKSKSLPAWCYGRCPLMRAKRQKHGMWALSEALSGLWGASPTTC